MYVNRRRRMVRAAGAGLVATGVFLATLLIFGGALFLGLDFAAGTSPSLVAAVVVATALIAAGAALPARALGARWRRSLAISCLVVGSLALSTTFLLSSGTELFILFYLFAFAAPAVIALAAAVGNGLSPAALISVLAFAAFFFVLPRFTGWILLPGMSETSAAFVQATILVAVGWTLLPALVGLFQRGRDES